jgi:hypothetical protein
MKKIYVKPFVEVLKMDEMLSLCAGSGPVTPGGNTPGDSTDIEGAKGFLSSFELSTNTWQDLED